MKYSHFTVAIDIMSAAPALMAGYRVMAFLPRFQVKE